MHDMEFTGEFETHLTISLDKTNRIEALQDWAAQHNLKCLHIVLDRGVTVSQPMLTRYGRGGLSGELAKAERLKEELNGAGFSVTRIKIEAAPWNQDIPQSASEAALHPADRYFEHHIKLLLEPEPDIRALTELAERHSADLSRNALRHRSDHRQERFVTQRCQWGSRGEAQRQLEALVKEIAARDYAILEVEEEFVVYDSNLATDAGWIRGEV
jgi:hypothetical protein